MRWKVSLVFLRCDRRHYDGRAVLVPHIVLYYQDRPYAALFGASYRTKICKIKVALLDAQSPHSFYDLRAGIAQLSLQCNRFALSLFPYDSSKRGRQLIPDIGGGHSPLSHDPGS